MAVNITSEVMSVEVERLKTSIKYHDWFLGFVVVIGVSLTVYLVDSMNSLRDDSHGVRMELQQVRQELQQVRQELQGINQRLDKMDQRIERLEQKTDRYHGNT